MALNPERMYSVGTRIARHGWRFVAKDRHGLIYTRRITIMPYQNGMTYRVTIRVDTDGTAWVSSRVAV